MGKFDSLLKKYEIIPEIPELALEERDIFAELKKKYSIIDEPTVEIPEIPKEEEKKPFTQRTWFEKEERPFFQREPEERAKQAEERGGVGRSFMFPEYETVVKIDKGGALELELREIKKPTPIEELKLQEHVVPKSTLEWEKYRKEREFAQKPVGQYVAAVGAGFANLDAGMVKAVSDYLGIEEKISKRMFKKAESLIIEKEYDKEGVWGLLKKGKIGKFLDLSFRQTLQSAPISTIAMTAYFAGQPWIGFALMGVPAYGQKKYELEEGFDTRMMEEGTQKLNAFLTALSEAGSEQLGAMVGMTGISKIIGRVGAKSTQAIISQKIRNSLFSKLAKYGKAYLFGGLSEGMEEVANSIATFFVDRASGLDVEWDAERLIFEPMTSGTMSGFMFESPMMIGGATAKGLDARKRNQYKNQVKTYIADKMSDLTRSKTTEEQEGLKNELNTIMKDVDKSTLFNKNEKKSIEKEYEKISFKEKEELKLEPIQGEALTAKLIGVTNRLIVLDNVIKQGNIPKAQDILDRYHKAKTEGYFDNLPPEQIVEIDNKVAVLEGKLKEKQKEVKPDVQGKINNIIKILDKGEDVVDIERQINELGTMTEGLNRLDKAGVNDFIVRARTELEGVRKKKAPEERQFPAREEIKTDTNVKPRKDGKLGIPKALVDENNAPYLSYWGSAMTNDPDFKDFVVGGRFLYSEKGKNIDQIFEELPKDLALPFTDNNGLVEYDAVKDEVLKELNAISTGKSPMQQEWKQFEKAERKFEEEPEKVKAEKLAFKQDKGEVKSKLAMDFKIGDKFEMYEPELGRFEDVTVTKITDNMVTIQNEITHKVKDYEQIDFVGKIEKAKEKRKPKITEVETEVGKQRTFEAMDKLKIPEQKIQLKDTGEEGELFEKKPTEGLQAEIKPKEKVPKEIYNLSWNNLDKKIPRNYDELVIPEIEEATQNIAGDILKNKIYNYIVYEYNKGNLEGILESINIHSPSGTKKVFYKISDKKINVKLISEEKAEKPAEVAEPEKQPAIGITKEWMDKNKERYINADKNTQYIIDKVLKIRKPTIDKDSDSYFVKPIKLSNKEYNIFLQNKRKNGFGTISENLFIGIDNNGRAQHQRFAVLTVSNQVDEPVIFIKDNSQYGIAYNPRTMEIYLDYQGKLPEFASEVLQEKPAEKQPYEMILSEYAKTDLIKKGKTELADRIKEGDFVDSYAPQHRKEIREALSRGDIVPEAVLKDYPELVKGRTNKFIHDFNSKHDVDIVVDVFKETAKRFDNAKDYQDYIQKAGGIWSDIEARYKEDIGKDLPDNYMNYLAEQSQIEINKDVGSKKRGGGFDFEKVIDKYGKPELVKEKKKISEPNWAVRTIENSEKEFEYDNHKIRVRKNKEGTYANEYHSIDIFEYDYGWQEIFNSEIKTKILEKYKEKVEKPKEVPKEAEKPEALMTAELPRGLKQFLPAIKTAQEVLEKHPNEDIRVFGSFQKLKRASLKEREARSLIGITKTKPDLDIVVNNKRMSDFIKDNESEIDFSNKEVNQYIRTIYPEGFDTLINIDGDTFFKSGDRFYKWTTVGLQWITNPELIPELQQATPLKQHLADIWNKAQEAKPKVYTTSEVKVFIDKHKNKLKRGQNLLFSNEKLESMLNDSYKKEGVTPSKSEYHTNLGKIYWNRKLGKSDLTAKERNDKYKEAFPTEDELAKAPKEDMFVKEPKPTEYINSLKGGKINEGKSNYYDLSDTRRENLRKQKRVPSFVYDSPLKVKYKRKGFIFFPKEKISSPADVAWAFRELKNEAVEKSYIIGIKDNIPIFVEPMSVGSISATIMNPYETLDLLLKKKVDGFYLVHNHPSGNVSASIDDIKVTENFKYLYSKHKINFNGSVIIDETKFGLIDFFSHVTQENMIKVEKPEKKVPQYTKYLQWTGELEGGIKISKAEDIANFIKGLNINWEGNILVTYLDVRNRVLATEFISAEKLNSEYLSKTAVSIRGTRIILTNNQGSFGSIHGTYFTILNNLRKELKAYTIDLLDVIEFKDKNTFISAEQLGLLRDVEPKPMLAREIEPYILGTGKAVLSDEQIKGMRKQRQKIMALAIGGKGLSKSRVREIVKDVTMLGRLTNLKMTPELLDNVYEEIKREPSKKRVVENRIIKDIKNRMKVKNLKWGYQEQIDKIKDAIILKKQTQKQRDALDRFGKFVKKQQDEGVEIKANTELLEDLGKKYVYEMSVLELEQLRDIIKSTIHQGRFKNRLINKRYIKTINEIADNIGKEARRGKPKEDLPVTTGERAKVTIIGKVKEFDRSLTRMERFLEHVGLGTESEAYRQIFKTMNDADNQYVINKENAYKNLHSEFKQEHKTLKKMRHELEKVKINNHLDLSPNAYKMAYIYSLTNLGRAHLVEGNNLTEQDLRDIEKVLTPSDKKDINYVMDLMGKYYPEINEIYKKIYGVNLPQRLNYFHFFLTDIESGRSEYENMSEILEKPTFITQALDKGMLKKRVGGRSPMILDFWGNTTQSIDIFEKYKAMGLAERDVRKIINHKNTKDAIKTNFGEGWYGDLKQWFGDVIGRPQFVRMSPIDKIFKYFRFKSAISLLYFNATVPPRQTGSLVLGISEAKLKHAIPSLIEYMAHPMKIWKIVAEKDPVQKHRRVERDLAEMINAYEKTHIKAIAGKKGAFEIGIKPVMFFDRMTVNAVWWMSYKKYLHENRTKIKDLDILEKKAVAYAQYVVRKTQPAWRKKDLPSLFRSKNEITKMMTMFQNYPNQLYNYATKDSYQAYKDKRINKIELMSRLWWSIVVSSFLYGLSRRWRLPDEKEALTDLLLYPLGMLPMGRDFGQILESKINNKPVYANYTTPPFIFLDATRRMIASKNPATIAKYGIKAMAFGLGVPYSQPYRTYRGITDFVKGETEDLRRIFVSEYALQKASDWKPLRLSLNSEYKKLKEKHKKTPFKSGTPEHKHYSKICDLYSKVNSHYKQYKGYEENKDTANMKIQRDKINKILEEY